MIVLYCIQTSLHLMTPFLCHTFNLHATEGTVQLYSQFLVPKTRGTSILFVSDVRTTCYSVLQQRNVGESSRFRIRRRTGR